MNERDIIDAYARELKLAAVRENVALLAEDAVREQWGTPHLPPAAAGGGSDPTAREK